MQLTRSTPIRPNGFGVAIARDNILYTCEALLDPLVIVFTLWMIASTIEGRLAPAYLILSLILFSLTFPSSSKINLSPREVVSHILINWVIIAGLLILFGIATSYIYLFPLNVILHWLWITPVCQLVAVFILRTIAPVLIKLQGPVKRTIIVGLTEQSLALAERLAFNNYIAAELLGFFEDKQAEPTPRDQLNFPILGELDDIAAYVKSHHVNIIYLSLPAARQEHIMHLLDELKDTTASIYFIPDIFQTDLIQARVGQIDDIPVVALCETPFTGFNGMIKRIADIAFSILILLLISPVLIAVATGVKLSSPGPIIFKQRRYGLYGEEILVYKFRSMTVCEDGATVTQATKQDQRVTPFGAFIRKTSLDELPQFINVLQGRMSIVGPRPHAVAHNEMYRKLIKGYMVRHKVKPGITGWAQVNGLRGETETLDKMKARIDYDIDYLRNWSPKLDIFIILKTVLVVFKGQNGAY
ncbi:MAG TPA: undecaprenyl-phosphate glucose phosphotransferase [Methylophilaceae bacterium]|jgi:putative colanic acid biosynthesis UDP-glucose lipid carrier transferase